VGPMTEKPERAAEGRGATCGPRGKETLMSSGRRCTRALREACRDRGRGQQLPGLRLVEADSLNEDAAHRLHGTESFDQTPLALAAGYPLEQGCFHLPEVRLAPRLRAHSSIPAHVHPVGRMRGGIVDAMTLLSLRTKIGNQGFDSEPAGASSRVARTRFESVRMPNGF